MPLDVGEREERRRMAPCREPGEGGLAGTEGQDSACTRGGGWDARGREPAELQRESVQWQARTDLGGEPCD